MNTRDRGPAMMVMVDPTEIAHRAYLEGYNDAMKSVQDEMIMAGLQRPIVIMCRKSDVMLTEDEEHGRARNEYGSYVQFQGGFKQ